MAVASMLAIDRVLDAEFVGETPIPDATGDGFRNAVQMGAPGGWAVATDLHGRTRIYRAHFSYIRGHLSPFQERLSRIGPLTCLISAEDNIIGERVFPSMGDERTQIPIRHRTRERLRFVKLLTGSSDYSDTIELLFRKSGYEPPEKEFNEENAKEALRGLGDD